MKQHLPAAPPSGNDFEATAVRVSMVSVLGNTILSVLKLLAGLWAHSGAMVSDAVHSASDVFSSLIVIFGVRLSAKASDREHPYGHERFECVAALVLAVILLVTGLFIGHTALEQLGDDGGTRPAIPGPTALAAAVVSIVCKEAMYWYTRHYARLYDSGALMADAWHHRSDALSSVGALVGIAGARMGFSMLDPLASLVICLFIVKAAFDIFKDAVGKLIDHSWDDDKERALLRCAMEQPGVLGVDWIHTRVFGSRILVDMEIQVDGGISLEQGYAIATRVHQAMEAQFAKVKHIMVQVIPAGPVQTDAAEATDRTPLQSYGAPVR